MPNTAIDQQGFRSSLALMGFQELNPGSWYLLRGAYFFIVTEGEKADLLTFGLAARIRSQKPVSLLFPARDPQRVDGFIARLTHEPSLAVPDTEEEEPAEETGEAPVPAPTAEIPEPVVTADGMEVARSVVLTPSVTLEDGTYTVQISETLATYAGVHLEEQTAVFTAKGFELAAALHAVTLEDGAVKVELTGEGRVLAAVYDQRGRMLACESRMAEGELTIPMNTTGASYAVVYLLEEGTMKPLCDAKSSR